MTNTFSLRIRVTEADGTPGRSFTVAVPVRPREFCHADALLAPGVRAACATRLAGRSCPNAANHA